MHPVVLPSIRIYTNENYAGQDFVIEEINMGMKRSTELACLVVYPDGEKRVNNECRYGSVKTADALGQSGAKSHWTIRLSSARHKRSWYIDPSGAQFSIFEPCMHEAEYLATYVESVRSINPTGTLRPLLQEHLRLSGSIQTILHDMIRSAIAAVSQAINRRTEDTATTVTVLKTSLSNSRTSDYSLLTPPRQTDFEIVWID